MSTKFSQQDKEALDKELTQAIRETWTLEELATLSQLFQERSWQLLQRSLDKLEELLNKEMWGPRVLNTEQLYHIRGQMRTLQIIRKLPGEIALARERLIES